MRVSYFNCVGENARVQGAGRNYRSESEELSIIDDDSRGNQDFAMYYRKPPCARWLMKNLQANYQGGQCVKRLATKCPINFSCKIDFPKERWIFTNASATVGKRATCCIFDIDDSRRSTRSSIHSIIG